MACESASNGPSHETVVRVLACIIMTPFVDAMVLRQSDSSHPVGLSSDEAARCLERFGPNDLVPARKTPSIWSWIVKLGSDPMALLLIATALTYLVLGDRVDAIVVSIALVPIFLVSAVLEIRADAAIDRLRDAVAPRVRVRRDGADLQHGRNQEDRNERDADDN